MYRIELYTNQQGKCSIEEYINELDKKANTSKNHRIKLTKIYEYLEVLSAYGTRAGYPYMKHIEDEIWELRPIDDRIFYAYYKDHTFVLLHYFTKKSQRTPKREIEQAKRNLKDFLERNGSL